MIIMPSSQDQGYDHNFKIRGSRSQCQDLKFKKSRSKFPSVAFMYMPLNVSHLRLQVKVVTDL